MLIVTMATAGVLGLIFFALALRVVQQRLAGRHLIGDGEDETMRFKIRAHANFAEYVPITLILMGLVESAIGARIGLIIVAILLVLARLLHMWGMTMFRPNKPRQFGIMLTWLALLTLSTWALLLALGIVS